MSLPRRAMEQMGFSICCLLCDAPDIPGSSRCKSCIASHTSARHTLTSGKAVRKAERLARELLAMLADPSSFVDHDDHGKWMQHYSDLIRDHQHVPDSKDQHRAEPYQGIKYGKRSLIGEIANQNRWADVPPNESEITEMKEILRGGDSEDPMTWDDLIAEIEELLEG